MSEGLVIALVRRRSASRLACVPAIPVLVILVLAAGHIPDWWTVVECSALLALCLLHVVRPTLLGWAFVLVWFALWAFEVAQVAVRSGYDFQVLPISLVLVPFAFLLVLRPRAEATERFAPVLALLVATVGVTPLFMMWPP
jgi:hypothetical protein